MAQLAVVYRFMLREQRDPTAAHRLLGSIDNAGTTFYSIAPELLRSIHHMVQVDDLEDPQPEVIFKNMVHVDGFHRTAALLSHFHYGDSGILNRHAQRDRTPYSEIDSHQTDIAIVLSAPPIHTVGFIGLQVPHGRGVKSSVEPEIRRFLREMYGLHLTLDPVVPLDAVANAIEQAGVGFVSFRRLNNPTDLFDDDSELWTDGSELAKVELKLSPRRSARLTAQRFARFIRMQGNPEVAEQERVTFDELATIRGQTYDELSIEVLLDGRKKVLRIDRNSHWMSHAFSWELQLEARPQPASIAEAIAELLPDSYPP